MKENILKKLEKYLWVRWEFNKREKQYIKATQIHAKYLKYIPWVLFIWIWNSIAMKNSHSWSDIDLFIIAQKNRLWTVRILTTFYFFILWKRKNLKNHAWKYCLSFFITEKALDFSTFTIENDFYLAYRIETLVPILDYNFIYKRFLSSNSWTIKITCDNIFLEQKKYIVVSGTKKKWNVLWNLFEKITKKLLWARTLKKRYQLWSPYGIIITDDILKFHNNDKRKQIRDAILDMQ